MGSDMVLSSNFAAILHSLPSHISKHQQALLPTVCFTHPATYVACLISERLWTRRILLPVQPLWAPSLAWLRPAERSLAAPRRSAVQPSRRRCRRRRSAPKDGDQTDVEQKNRLFSSFLGGEGLAFEMLLIREFRKVRGSG